MVDTVKSEIIGEVGVLCLSLPPVNALAPEVISGLIDAASEITAQGIKALVLSGEGRCFCAGADILRLKDEGPEENARYFDEIYKMLDFIENQRVPVIAAINGPAMGAGMELALCCDLRVMDRGAVMGATSVNLGLVFCTQRLPRLIGYSRARELLLTARLVKAEEAERWGMVHRVVPEGRAISEAISLAQIIAGKSPQAVASVKEALRLGEGLKLSDALQVEAGYLKQMFVTQEFQTRTQQFAAGKRW